ncbi:hypothetical protein [Paenibacillus silviterrae]|uniref:hypothetical protein n=1 Tax=Paenibacillus silviterrae TaxID=3242194 RepID=UPI002542A473|nr:hypothetical protein [Paenibacillus chinjuensis]
MRPPKRSTSGAVSRLNVSKHRSLAMPTQRLRRLTVVWVDPSGNPFNTRGFFATISTVGGRILQTARFDSFGVVVFSRIVTPTSRTLVIRTYDANGVFFRRRTIPAGNAAFAIIG